jgi:hypothetical protein
MDRKLLVFVPSDALDVVRDASSAPVIGERHGEVVAAMRAAHAYEEPAYDVYERLS